MPTPAEPGRPARRLLGRGPGAPVSAPVEASRGAAEQEALPGPAPSRDRGEAPGPPDVGAHESDLPEAEPFPPGPAATSEPGARGGAGPAAARTSVPGAAPVPPGPEALAGSAGRGSVLPGAGSVLAEPDAGVDVGVRGEAGARVSGTPGVVPGVEARAGAAVGAARGGGGEGRFTLRLANFEGPFDLLLQLISRHKLDVTEVALSKVTDEFMAHIRAMGPDWDLDQTTEFLVVAATLLDLKAARLLPVAEVEDEADLALLEARDLLFARLLQYKAYKQIAEIFRSRAESEGKRYPRTVGLEPHHAELLPEVVISIGAEGFARLAVKAMQPRAEPQVYVDHIHAPLVSVREQAGLVVAMLRARGEATFQELTEGAPDTLTVVARFLALLELYREKAVVLDQEEALKTLTVRWSGGEGDGLPTVTDEFDQIVEAKE
ncbi:segregation/condensation protein A [Streptomyces sp. APSN-46.1]|uniref:segregation and condensation protein A n=1 Tax=Streptomyces sp. APSN-46.1 TaxID=2929049 RepID=UPI001FB3B4D8|nr:segregation/condensation protein A [Streptomyces sp. APSN-46.1]MCJ1679752.1 segregation/condensation protein A [Streptomyces sp. APSN-46.1]